MRSIYVQSYKRMLTAGVQIRRNHDVDDYTEMMTQQSMRYHACDDTDVIPVLKS